MRSIILTLFAGILAACQQSIPTAASSLKDDHAIHDHDAPAAVHGMVLFGSDKLYASHVPMFMVPHDWQALLQVEISHPTIDVLAAYAALFQDGIQPLVTLRPKPFVLPKLLNEEIMVFEATLHRGNFEQGGPVVLAGVQVTVKKVLYKAQLSAATQPLTTLTYLPIIADGDAYLVHKISGPSNFDHIVQVAWQGPATAELVFAGTADLLATRLQAGQIISLSLADGPATIEVTSDFYCTPGPDFFGDCN